MPLTRFVHPLAQAAVFQEFLFQRPDLLIEQIVRLMDQTDRDVRDHLRRTRLHVLAYSSYVCGVRRPNCRTKFDSLESLSHTTWSRTRR